MVGLSGALLTSQTPAGVRNRPACALPPPTLGKTLGVEAVAGALVITVDKDSPAERAGLAPGDVVVALGQNGVRDYASHEAFRYAIHDAAMFTGASLRLWKYDAATDSFRSRVVELRTPARLGSRDGFATILRVMVTAVPDGSAAATAGLRPWDVIEEIDGESVNRHRDLVGLDIRIRDVLAREGRVELTVARWRPAPEGEEGDLSRDTRQIQLSLPAAAQPPH